jgi:hypothetical protein
MTFNLARKRPDALLVSRLKQWVRMQMSLADDAVILISELACSEPGCPPIETVIGVFLEGGVAQRFKLHSPVAEISEEDVRRVCSV